jgi:hypothetical protein
MLPVTELRYLNEYLWPQLCSVHPSVLFLPKNMSGNLYNSVIIPVFYKGAKLHSLFTMNIAFKAGVALN